MKEKLTEYKKKRDFNKTKEPSGKSGLKSSSKKKKYLIQYHLARKTHYDFRLEHKGVLLSWAVPKGPSFDPKDKRLAVKVEDHPLDYASFEGVIPKGQYGGGTVMLWDEGHYEALSDFDKGLKNGVLKFAVFGKRIKGKWTLIRLKEEEGEESKNWLLIKEKDDFVLDDNGIEEFTTSIVSGRTSDEINNEENITLKKNPYNTIEVQLATLVEKIPDSKEYLYEIKYDGYRIVAFIERDEVRLITRNGIDFSDKFKSICLSLKKLAKGRAMILDGEMVVTDEEGKTNFQELQNYVKKKNNLPLSYICFDILALDGNDLRETPLIKRKEILKEILKDALSDITFSEHVIGKGKECFNAAEKLGLEGIIGKRLNSSYEGLRNDNWIKVKCYKRQEFVIGGYTLSNLKSEGISSLLLGVYENNKLIYVGRAGTGMDKRTTQDLLDRFKALVVKKSPFKELPKNKHDEESFFLKPLLVAEIQYAELTNERVLRQASFKGLRDDKLAREVKMETESKSEDSLINKNITKKKATSKKKENDSVLGIDITSKDKIVFPEKKIKKIDIINYYLAASSRMLLYAGNRIVSVVRCHQGVKADCFFKKHPTTKREGIGVVDVTNSEGVTYDYFFIENEKGLISEVQMGTIEFHVWGSKADDMDRPDMMVFDLDPDEGMGLAQIRQGVKDCKKILDSLGLKSFLKTSGGKGYHIVVPFTPSVDWDTFHDFSKLVAIAMENKWPDRYTSNIRKKNRKGKIFIDWARNGRGSTSVAAYSLRARVGASVSMPIRWSELDKIAPNEIDINTAMDRLKKQDPWKGFYSLKQQLKKNL